MKGISALLPFLVLFLLAGCATAQSTLKKKDQQRLSSAREALGLNQYREAKVILDRLVAAYPAQADLHYLRSEIYLALGQYAKAEADIRAGISRSGEAAPVVYRKLGEAASLGGNFSGAVAAYREYVNKIPATARGDRRQKAVDLLARAEAAAALAANPIPYRPIRLSDSINTGNNLEYFPTLDVTESRMVFTRRVLGQNEDFYVSDRQEDGSWGAARPLPGVNTEFDEGGQTLTADGQYLVYTSCGRPQGYGGCDLLFFEYVDDAWQPARRAAERLNTQADEGQPSISPDGRLLFFSSNREGGYGGNDLYAAARTADGGWSSPQNLGPNLNTKGQESFPFWAADGRTLFFTSNGHPGLGGQDLFRIVLGGDNKWGTATNLGYPINTAGNETNLFIALNGSTAYFSKRSIDTLDGKADVDIYAFDLPTELQPDPATYVRATVTDAVSGAPLEASVRLRPLDQQAPPVVRSTDAGGEFLAVLPAGKDYAFTVDRQGYVFYADRFTLPEGQTPEEPFLLKIALQPVPEAVVAGGSEEDGSTAFQNVLFATASAELLPVSADELDRLAELLIAAPRYRVTIGGHTDDVGEEADNLELSRQRALAVKNYLVGRGVEENRIRTEGFGESRPVADNAKPEGRAKNRRTTFLLEGE
ncbi:MAG: OmpA family protein [Bacteroidota bacterium]